MLQGGSGNATYPADTWYYSAPNDTFAQGMQDGGSALRLRCTRFPVSGKPTGFAMDNPSGIGWLSISLGPAPQPGLSLAPGITCGSGTLCGVPAKIMVAVTGNPGSVTFDVPHGLDGFGFVIQGIALDPALCLRLSDPLAVTVHAQ